MKDFKEEVSECGFAICVCKLVLITVRLSPSSRHWKIGHLSSLMIIFQRDISLTKTSQGCRKFASQRCRERIYNFKFSKVNALRKGRLGADSQEEIYLKFSQAGVLGHLAILITSGLYFTPLFSDIIQKTICTISKSFGSLNISQIIMLIRSTEIMLIRPKEQERANTKDALTKYKCSKEQEINTMKIHKSITFLYFPESENLQNVMISPQMKDTWKTMLDPRGI